MVTDKKAAGNSRRERRKEARKAKNLNKHQSWLQHQKSQKLRNAEISKITSKNPKPGSKNPSNNDFNQREGNKQDVSVAMKLEVKSESLGRKSSNASKMVKGNGGLKRNSKTKFGELVEMDMKVADRLAQEDLRMERRLAKKLKVKNGKLRGGDDEINMIIGGTLSTNDSFEEDETPDAEELSTGMVENDSSNKKRKKKKSSLEFVDDEPKGDLIHVVSEPDEASGAEVGLEEVAANANSSKKHKKRKRSKQKQESIVAHETENGALEPQPLQTHDVGIELKDTPTKLPVAAGCLKYVAPHLRSRAGNKSEEHTQIRRRIRGLLNKLSESNVESVTGEMATIFRSVSPSISSQIISQEVLVACYSGPRGSEQYAAVFAAFVAGMACSVGVNFSAKLMTLLAKSFEDEYLKEDDLSLRNLSLLLSYLCIFGVFSSDLIYDFLIMSSKRLTETDIPIILTVLQCCGIKIRADDPTAMKNFIQSVQNRVNELKASCREGQTNVNGKRMEFMLETISDIKNNKKKPREETVQRTRIKKWLQKLKVDDILIRGLKWSKLLDPDKKGQWWLSGDMASMADDVEEVANTIDKEVLEAQKMLQLAAAQRMNTDARRAIFCIIMTGEDYIDAFEKLLRLNLPGTQDREIMRVLLECCLQEKIFNKYYTILAFKLCEHDKNHKRTLQYCIWDQFKELESMQLLRSMHLAKFVAEMVASFTQSLAVLKAVDLSDASLLTPKRIMNFRMLFEAIFEHPDSLVWNMFTRVAVTPELEVLRNSIEFFIREYVAKENDVIAKKFKVAKKALNNAEGVLM